MAFGTGIPVIGILRRGSVLALAATLVFPVIAQTTTADQDYERIQSMRDDAGKKAKEGTPDALRAARATLIEATEQLDRPDIREKSTGNRYLWGRRHDVNRDLAIVNARLGDREGMLKALDAMARSAWIPRVADTLEKNSAFSPYANDEEFKEIIRRIKTSSAVLEAPALATPFKERLTVEERIAGLSLFWSEARNYFVHFDNAPDLSWDAVYLQFLPRVIAADTTREYYDVMRQLAPLLNDGHTNVYPPNELSKFYARPPIRTEWVNGKVLVTDVRSAKLAEQVRFGDEIIAIDGTEIHRYAAEKVQPYVSSSTAQDRQIRTYTYQLLQGDADAALQLTLRGADGAERNVSIARGGYTDLARTSSFEFRLLPDGTAYLALDHFESDAGVKAFEAALPQILASKGLILDLRRNGGGSTGYGLTILSYLTDQPIHHALSMVRSDNGFDRARFGSAITWTPVDGTFATSQRERKQRFDGPVAVLAGPQTFSAAEDFLVSFATLKRGPIVGEPTGGSTGQPMVFKLPGGGRARICVKRDTFPDGTRLVGVGIKPTVVVAPTVEQVRSKKDPVLDAAVVAVASLKKS